MSQNYKCISGDTHLEIPNDRWTYRIDKKYRDRAPFLGPHNACGKLDHSHGGELARNL